MSFLVKFQGAQPGIALATDVAVVDFFTPGVNELYILIRKGKLLSLSLPSLNMENWLPMNSCNMSL